MKTSFIFIQRILVTYCSIVLPFVYFSGCTEPVGNRPVSQLEEHETERRNGDLDVEEDGMHVDEPSADCFLGPEEYEAFQPDSSMDDILMNIQWCGNFEMATSYKGQRVSAISYVVSGGTLSHDGEGVWAIFIDDKFQKFVKWPDWGKQSTLKVGEFTLLIQALENEPLVIVDQGVVNKDEMEPPAQVDPGLTDAILKVRSALKAKHDTEFKRNTELRNQFNAAKLKIGMTEAEVNTIVKARPLEMGVVEAGEFRIYGSRESISIVRSLHYSNIMLLFNDEKVCGIYSGSTVPGGEYGLQQMRDWFVELSRPKLNSDVDGAN